MEEHIEYNPSFTMLTLALAPGESVKAEPGAMVCQSGVEMQTGMSGGGGIGGFFKSSNNNQHDFAGHVGALTELWAVLCFTPPPDPPATTEKQLYSSDLLFF